MGDRVIRAGILSSEKVCSLSWGAEVFYRRLMSVADDFGRYDGRVTILRTSLYPLQIDKVSDADVGKWRLETAKAGLVSVYSVGGKEYVEIQNFGQRLRAEKSKWPSPADSCQQPPADDSDGGRSQAYTETETERKARSRKEVPVVENLSNRREVGR